jgi:tetratricopeptide (TPR) repeat protein
VEQAVDLAERAMALDAFEPVAFTTLAGARLLQDRPADAVAAARRAVELGPNSDLCYGVQAMSLAADGHIFEAIRSLERAMRINPREPGLYWMLLGEMQAAGGRVDEALTTWETLRASNPDAIPPRLRLAAHFAGPERARARDLVREILAINPAFTAEHALQIDPTRRDPRRAADLLALLRVAGLP